MAYYVNYNYKKLPLNLKTSPFEMPAKLVIPAAALTHDGPAPIHTVGYGEGENPNFDVTKNPHVIPAVCDLVTNQIIDTVGTSWTDQYLKIPNPCSEISLNGTNLGDFTLYADTCTNPTYKTQLGENFGKLKPLAPDVLPMVKAACSKCGHQYWMKQDQMVCTLCETLDAPAPEKKETPYIPVSIPEKVCLKCGTHFQTLSDTKKFCKKCSKCNWCGGTFENLTEQGYCSSCSEYFKPKQCSECGKNIPIPSSNTKCGECTKKANAAIDAQKVAEKLKLDSDNFAKDKSYLGYKKKYTYCQCCESDYKVNQYGYCEDCWNSDDVTKHISCSSCGLMFDMKTLKNGKCAKCNPEDPESKKPLKVTKPKTPKPPLMFKANSRFHVLLKGKTTPCGIERGKETPLTQKDIATVKEAFAEFVCPKCKAGLAHV